MRRSGYLPRGDGPVKCSGGRGRIGHSGPLKILPRSERNEQRFAQGDREPRFSFSLCALLNQREKCRFGYLDGQCNQYPDIRLLRLWSPETDARFQRKLFPVPVVQ